MNIKTTLIVLLSSGYALAQTGSSAPASQQVIMPVQATIPYQGAGETEAYLGEAEYEIFMGMDNVLDKPVILLDAYDPGDGRDIQGIYGVLNYGTGQNLADELRVLGYDIVIVNFPNYMRAGTSTMVDGASDFIQRNAFVVTEVINQVNAQKSGTEQNVVIGPSTGGLIARYALRYMEMNSMSHDTRLFVSFDAPHRGANIPIGMQHLFNFMAYGPFGDASLQMVVDGMLRTPVARQILIDHFEAHLQAGSQYEFNNTLLLPMGSPGFRDAFQNELNSMGMPQNTRNVAISNGSGNETMNGTPNMVLMDHTFDITATERAIINLRFTPAANQTNQVSRFRAQTQVFGIWITVTESLANSKAPATSAGLDSAPGSRFDMSQFGELAAADPMFAEFFENLTLDYFTFVPTRSALAISDNPDWYAPVTTGTPFAATSVPMENENHMTLSTANMAFTLNEILNPPLTVAQNSLNGLTAKNPFNDSIDIYSTNLVEDADITLTDISGKIMMTISDQNINGQVSIPVTLPNGMYFLKIKNHQGSVVKKLIKN